MSDPIVIQSLSLEPIVVSPNLSGSPQVIALSAIPGPPGAALSVIEVPMDAGVSVLSPGVKADISVEHAHQITGWTLIGDLPGDLEMDVMVTSLDDYPAGFASIVGATPPAFIGAQKGSGDAADWTIDLAAGSILRVSVISAVAVRRATLALKVGRVS